MTGQRSKRSWVKRYLIGEISWVRLVRSLLFIYVVLFVFALTLSERLIFLPPSASYQDRPDVLKLTTKEGQRISALYLPQPSSAKTILFSHGNAEDLGYARPDLEMFQRLGFAVLAYDYRGYGTSEGKPSEKASYSDIEAAYDHLRERLSIPAQQILVYGRSLGGGPSVELASKRPVGGLVLESTFVSAFRVVTRIPLLPFDRFRNLRKISSVRCPVLVMHGTADRVVPFWHGQKLFEAAHEPKRFWRVEGGGHLDLMGSPDYANTLLTFAASALSPPK